MNKLVNDIINAPIYGLAKNTPLELARQLSDQLDQQVYMKREDLQPIDSFKIRGAFNKIVQLSDSQKQRGLTCVSAGNHAQGVALSAKTLGLKAHIIMPITTPKIKSLAVDRLGATVELFGDSFSESARYCDKIRVKNGLTLIHPYDDQKVIAGQGTIAREILCCLPSVNYIFVPVGGGGLLAGLLAFIKAQRPEVKVIAVEPYESDAMYQSIKVDRRVQLSQTGTFVDGVSVKQVGRATFKIVRSLCDGFIRVTNDEICIAIEDGYQENRRILEPAGALSIAGMKKFLLTRGLPKQQRLVCINSGANMNFQNLQFVAERVLSYSQKEHIYAIELQDVPGSLLKFCRQILCRKFVTEFNFRATGDGWGVFFVGIADLDKIEKSNFEVQLSELGYRFFDITQNDLAKDHIRHMVGGEKTLDHPEEIFKFRFPERPGSLEQFLCTVGCKWNISLFHYRSHGTDFGRVLVGFDVSASGIESLISSLNKTGYPYNRETENIAYKLFLCDRKTKFRDLMKVNGSGLINQIAGDHC